MPHERPLVPPSGGCFSRVYRPPVAYEAIQRGVGTHIKVVVAPHLDGELFSNPGPHLRPFRGIEAAALVDLAYNPLALALLGEDPAKTGVVGRTPENEGDEKEAAGEGAWPEVFKDCEKDGSGGVYRSADEQIPAIR